MRNNDVDPGQPAPREGLYEELNIFGSPTGRQTVMKDGEQLPAAPRGFSWRPLAELSIEELRQKAAGFRRMATTATTPEVMSSLLKLAERLDALIEQREQTG